MDAVQYPYQPLSGEADDLVIRLLRIQPGDESDYIRCTLSHHILSNQHTCLSYTWGSAEPTSIIYIDNHPIRIQQNLFKFLVAARRYKYSEPIWVDAVCINQKDEVEKSKQVSSMATIYSHAKSVVVWLGLPESNCKTLFGVQWLIKDDMHAARTNDPPIARLLQALRDEYSWSSKIHMERASFLSVDMRNPETYIGYPAPFHTWIAHLRNTGVLDDLAEAPYWKRAWVVQELVLAQRVLMLTPVGKLDLLPIISFFRQYIARNKQVLHDTYFSTLPFEQFAEFRWRQKGHLPLDQSLPMGLNRECGDPRDRVFSILSLTRDGSYFKVDYSKDQNYIIWRAVWFAWTQHKIARFAEVANARQHVLAVGTMVRNMFASFHIHPPTSSLTKVSSATKKLFGYEHSVSDDEPYGSILVEDLFHRPEEAAKKPIWTKVPDQRLSWSQPVRERPRCPFGLSLTFVIELESQYVVVEWPLIREEHLEPFGWTLDIHKVHWWTLDKSLAAKRPGHFLDQHALTWLGKAQSRLSRWKQYTLE